MKYCKIITLLFVFFALSSCSNVMQKTCQIDEIDVSHLFSEQDTRRSVLDISEHYMVVEVGDANAMPHPNFDETAQITPEFVKKIMVIDLQATSVFAEYPIEQYGILQSAIYAHGGVYYSLVFLEEPDSRTGIYFVNETGTLQIYSGWISPFYDGPTFRVAEDLVYFSCNDGISPSFELFSVDAQQTMTQYPPLIESDSHISDFATFEMSSERICYRFFKDGIETFRLDGSEPFEIPLGENERSYDFSLANEILYVSLFTLDADGTQKYLLRSYDFSGAVLNEEVFEEPIFGLAKNDTNSLIARGATSITLYDISNGIKRIETNGDILEKPVSRVIAQGNKFYLICKNDGETLQLYQMTIAT